MRKFIDIISEALRPTKTRELDTTTLMPAEDGALMPHQQSAAPPATISLKGAGRSATVAAAARAQMPEISADQHSNLLRDLQGIADDEITDAEAAAIAQGTPTATATGYSEPVRVENLPAVIRDALITNSDNDASMASFNPDWHQVKDLPGYMVSALRNVARGIMRVFTNTPIEEIQMMATVINPASDVRRMAGWIVRNGVEQDSAELDFSEQMPAYHAIIGKAQCKLYNALGYQFLITQDEGGHYIYAWPEDQGRLHDINAGRPALPGL